MLDHIEPDRTLQAEALALATHLDHPLVDCLDLVLAPHEASLLNLGIDKAHQQLGWSPRWDFATTVERTVGWYRQVQEGVGSALEWSQAVLALYQKVSPHECHCEARGRSRGGAAGRKLPA